MQIGIGTPLPLIGNLPSQGQGGGGITFTYVDQDYCSNASDPSPTVVPAGGTFSELDGNSGLVINATTGVIDISASTSNASYTAKYTAPDGKSANFPINISTYPAVTITGNSSVCEGTATTLTVASGYSYQWYKDSVLISGATSNTYNPDVNTVGSSVYYVIATNTFSGITCTDQSANFTFTVNAAPSVTISTVPGATICTGDSVTLTANPTGGSGVYTYQWSDASGAPIPGITTNQTLTVSPNSDKTYNVVVTSNGCDSATVSQAITVSSAPTAIDSIDNDYALEFDGQSYVSAGNPTQLQITSNLTVSSWFKILNNSGNRVIVARDAVSTNFRNWSLYVVSGSGKVKALLRNNTNIGWNSVESSLAYDDGKWHHAAFVYTPSTSLILYVDGVAVDTETTSITPSIYNATADLTIGAYSQNQGGYTSDMWTGDIDEVAVWNSSLSACDVAGIYNATTTVNGQPKSANLLDANTTIPAPVYWNRMGD